MYPLNVGEAFNPYVGGGLGYTNISFDTDTDTRFGDSGGSDTGLNLVGGAEFETGGAVTPFAQLQFTVGDLDRLGIMGGILFSL